MRTETQSRPVAGIVRRERATSGRLLPRPPHVPVRAAAIEALVHRVVPRLPHPLEIRLPDGRVVEPRTSRSSGAAPTGGARLTVHSPQVFHRLGAAGKIGLGESYMAGEWDADDLPGTLTALAEATDRVPAGLWRLLRRIGSVRPPDQANTLEGAARNISHHYDLSNDLFAVFLDASMTYSSAVFAPGDDLERAQHRKRRLLLDPLDLGPHDHLLEIGTGWGSMAVHAARHTGCRVTTITLSEEQAAYAREVVAAAGLDDRVEVVVRDYREVTGTFDAVVSVEMIEAVGEAWWPTYFRQIRDRLAPHGRAAIQTITMTHDAWRASRSGYGWIHRYIFPGGEIPSLQALATPVADAGLAITGRRDIGPHYAETLRRWRERFLAHRSDVASLGFDATFIRMWDFYLAYCEAGFRTGRLGASQVVLAPSAASPSRHAGQPVPRRRTRSAAALTPRGGPDVRRPA